ncbi:MAG: hypothetical protein IKX43_06855 [Paludibacteraceae bacterium]|nr:hypothetical protein [Paludibacteraceae bacterium]
MMNTKRVVILAFVWLSVGVFAQQPDRMRIWLNEGASQSFPVNSVDSVTFGSGWEEEVGSTWTAPPVSNRCIPLMLTSQERDRVRLSNEFSKKCFSAIYKTADTTLDRGDFFFSPMGLQMALAMCANGASEGAKEEILSALGFSGETALEDMNTYYHKIYKYLASPCDSVRMEFPSALWVRGGAPVDERFSDVAKRTFYATIGGLDSSSDSVSVKSTVDDWVRTVTHGQLDQSYADVSSDEGLALHTTSYMLGRWWTQLMPRTFFDYEWNEKAMCVALSEYRMYVFTGFADTDQYQAMEVRFGPYEYLCGINITNKEQIRCVNLLSDTSLYNHAYSMILVQPKEGYAMEDVMENIQWEALPLVPFPCWVRFPFVDFSRTYEWKDFLGDMGIKKLFEEPFAAVDGGISRFSQECKAYWNDRGFGVTDSSTVYPPASANGAMMAELPERGMLDAKKTTLVVFRDNLSGLVLFMGRVKDLRNRVVSE